MARQNQGPNLDQFEAFFKRADLDGDGRISGAEAVAFFQGSNLPKQVLAQIWMHADQARTGFLGRTEFFNALKLVTVSQSKRELTPDIVKAALYGPAAAKIPAPQISLPAAPTPQFNSMAATSAPHMGAVAPTSTQNLGLRGPGLLNANMNQNYFPQQNQSMRPPQPMPAGAISRPPQGITSTEISRGGSAVGSGVPNSSISNDWLGGRTGGATPGPRGVSPSNPSAASKPPSVVSMSSQPTVNISKALDVSGNGFASDSVFGGDIFSAAPSSSKQEPSSPIYSASSAPASSAIVPVSSRPQPSVKPNSFDSLQSAFSMQPAGNQLPRTQPPLTPSQPTQQVPAQGFSSFAPSGISAGSGNFASNNSQIPWPKMKPSDVQKYTKVFMEVDADRDGKITGEEARNLFLSWRLPREVLKQVWDLSDQDNDSMLSLREFCFALYLMERFREGRPLPAALPSNIMFDETLLSMTGQPNVTYGNAAWGASHGFGQQQGMGARPVAPATGLRPPMQVTAPLVGGSMPSNQQKSRVPVLGGSFLDQHDNGEQTANSKLQEATAGGKKGDGTENVILDSKEKIEFYRSKMQELVLYKSRCDNRLNEITERAIADKREAESLGKKYEEKYKQVAEIASKLTIEEAKFRDIQGRKMELHQAIIKMEQGGSADGILQVRADRIQSDLEELLWAITERCKKHGLDVKSTALIELPIGWQPGVQEGAVDWDEDWDKFEEEGFVNDLPIDVKNVSLSPRSKLSSVQRENASSDHTYSPDSLSNADGKPGDHLSTGERALESEYSYAHSEDELARSPHGSPARRTTLESQSPEYSDVHFEKSTEADAETHGSFDENWGVFDNNDDIDSVWGFNPVNTKDEKHRDFFGSDDFGVNSARTESPNEESTFQKKSPFTFEDAVPGTPLSRFGNSPPRYSESSRDQFDNFSRFDSFSMNESPKAERFTRFDSISSAGDFGGGHSRELSYDFTDPFGSSGPFKVSSDSQAPKKDSANWNAF